MTEVVEASKTSGETRAQKIKDLNDRKTYNTTTSIYFGGENVHYESDAQYRQKDILRVQNDSDGRMKTMENNIKMKKALTTTNFNLGDERPTYQTTNTQVPPEGDISQYRGELQEEVKEMVKASHLDFGSTIPNYNSMAHDSMALTTRNSTGGRIGPDKELQQERGFFS